MRLCGTQVSAQRLLVRILAEIAAGVAFIERARCAYIDLKEENVLLQFDIATAEADPDPDSGSGCTQLATVAEFQVKLCDFHSLVRMPHGETSARALALGSPLREAPEARGGGMCLLTPRASVYSLGVLAKEMFSRIDDPNGTEYAFRLSFALCAASVAALPPCGTCAAWYACAVFSVLRMSEICPCLA